MTARRLAHRNSILWMAALVHRLSGLALAVFLPLHFLALGLAIRGEAHLESFLRWSDQPLVKLAESGLVFLLVVHMLGGLRLLLIENLAVDPSCQGIGHGRRLLAFAEERARGAGIPELRLYTHEKMTENIELYERNGYVEYERRTQEGRHGVFMAKRTMN